MKLRFAIFLLLGVLMGSIGLDTSELNTGFGVGTHLFQQGDDFVLGMDLGGPLFLENSMGTRASLDAAWRGSDWTPYFAAKLGILGSSGLAEDFARFYGSGGIHISLENAAASPQVLIGGYGSFGFEFFLPATGKTFAYYLEIGGSGSPLEHGNGFLAGAGFRWYPRNGKVSRKGAGLAGAFFLQQGNIPSP